LLETTTPLSRLIVGAMRATDPAGPVPLVFELIVNAGPLIFRDVVAGSEMLPPMPEPVVVFVVIVPVPERVSVALGVAPVWLRTVIVPPCPVPDVSAETVAPPAKVICGVRSVTLPPRPAPSVSVLILVVAPDRLRLVGANTSTAPP
jgi:hypothetical protein